MTETTGRRVRIETETDGRIERTRVFVGDTEITDQIIAVDWHIDHQSLPTATLTVGAPDMAVEATEAEGPSPLFGAGELLAGADPILCFPCLIDRHNGVREDALPAMVIFNGNGICKDHFKIQDGPAPLPDRTPSGFILPNGPVNGGH